MREEPGAWEAPEQGNGITCNKLGSSKLLKFISFLLILMADPVRSVDWVPEKDDRLRLSRQEIRELCEAIVSTRQDERIISTSLDKISESIYELATAIREGRQ